MPRSARIPAAESTPPASGGDGLPFRLSLEAVNCTVGLTALGLPLALLSVAMLGNLCPGIDSISHFYFTRLGGDILVTALGVIGMLLLVFYRLPAPTEGYRGHHRADLLALRLAGLGAFGVAFLPAAGPGCAPDGHTVMRAFLTPGPTGQVAGFDFWGSFGITSGPLPFAHYASALVMFAVLAWFALVVFARPQSTVSQRTDGTYRRSKQARNAIYRTCGGLIVLSIAALGFKALFLRDVTGWNSANLTFWFEALALIAFGVSWSVKGRLFGLFRDPGEIPPRVAAA